MRGVCQPYGWVNESGTLPQPHLDVIVITDEEYEFGNEVQIRIVGGRHSDDDHKLVDIPGSRKVSDFAELTEFEISDRNRLYRKKHEGDGWFGREMVEKIIAEFFARLCHNIRLFFAIFVGETFLPYKLEVVDLLPLYLNKK